VKDFLVVVNISIEETRMEAINEIKWRGNDICERKRRE
jgi:hypothetical protein